MRRVIRRHVRRRTGGIDLAVDVNAVVSVNHGTTGARSVQSASLTQDASTRAAEEGRERPADTTTPDSTPEEER
jgi:hypothetical protein